MLSGSWPGELYVFYRKSDDTFAACETLKDKKGKKINVGSASHLHAADGDGDLDLLVGNISGEVHLIINSGTKEKPVFESSEKLKADGKTIMAKHGDAGPAVVDWNGDGKLDLLVGSGEGSVYWYQNRGSSQKPILAAGKVLVPAPTQSGGTQSNEKTLPCQTRVKVCVVDWNGDGRQDLLVGDFAMITIEQKLPADAKEKKEKANKKTQEVLEKYTSLNRKLAGKKISAEERKKIEKELEGVLEQYRAAATEAAKYQPQRMEYRGRVWLFQRKGGERIASGRK